jgi:nucleotide-binding universal stress UspA family protein
VARAWEAEVLALHVGPETAGREIVRRVAADLEGIVEVAGSTDRGQPAERIVARAREEGCDLIVVGSRGTTGATRFGSSVPSKVARRAPCHVLIVKRA